MGCCNKEKSCQTPKASMRRIPWFGLLLGLLAVLVIVNWR